MADVFLSYKREERAEVERLANALRGLGLDVWFDASLSAGEVFSREIEREVSAALAVLVCWSEKAAKSDWVHAEALTGFERKVLISTYITGPDGFRPPMPFHAQHMEDLRTWIKRPSARDPAWLSVLRSVGRHTLRADISEWGALGEAPSVAQVESWLKAHSETSTLTSDAMNLLREREAAERELAAELKAERERAARLLAEKAAAEAEAREARERAAAEARAAEAERRAREAEARAEKMAAEAAAKEEAKRLQAVEAAAREIERAKSARKAALAGVVWLCISLSVLGAALWGGYTGLRFTMQAWLPQHFPSVQMLQDADLSISPAYALGNDSSLVLDGEITFSNFSPDGTLFVVPTGRKGDVGVWDTATGEKLRTLQGHSGAVNSACFSPNGEQILTSSSDQTARIWDTNRGEQVAVLRGHEDRVRGAAFSRNGKLIVTSSSDQTARIWNADTAEQLTKLWADGADALSAAFSSDGQQVFTSSYLGQLRVWSMTSGSEVQLEGPQYVYALSVSPVENRFVATSDKDAWVRDELTGRAIVHLTGHEERIISIKFSPDGTRVVTTSEDNTARIWDSVSGAELFVLRGHLHKGADESEGKKFKNAGFVVSADFSPDGEYLATGGTDHTVRIWNASSGEQIATLRGHDKWVTKVEFSPDGTQIVTASWGGNVRSWKIFKGG